MKLFYALFTFSFVSQISIAQLQSFEPTSDASGTEFGIKVAISGDDLMVSSKSTTTEPGKVYLFNTDLQQTQVFYPADAQIDDQFGSTLAIGEDFIFIGAPQNDTAAENAGAVYVYRKNGTAYEFLQKITDTDTRVGDQFGNSVKIQDGFLYVRALGDEFDSENSNTNRGSLSVYLFNGTEWAFSQKLQTTDVTPFGITSPLARIIAINDDRMVLQDRCFRQYYQRFGTTWVHQSSAQMECHEGGSPTAYIDGAFSDGQFIELLQVKIGTPRLFFQNPVQDEIEFPYLVTNEDMYYSNFVVDEGRLFVGNPLYPASDNPKYPVLYYKKIAGHWEFQSVFYGNGAEDVEDLSGNAMATDGGKAVFGAPKEGNGKAYFASEATLKNDHFGKGVIGVFPNPVHDVLKINKELTDISNVEVYSVSGKLLISVDDNPETIDMTKLGTGMYFVKITATDGTKQSFKVIKT